MRFGPRRASLRLLVVLGFALLVFSTAAQGVLAIVTTAHSAQQVSSLETNSVVPAVTIGILSQNLDEERELLDGDFSQMKSTEVRAIEDEIASLDTNIIRSAPQVLLPATMSQFHAAWSSYVLARSAYLAAALHRPLTLQPMLSQGARGSPPGGQDEALRRQYEDRLDRVLDLIKSDAGVHLYQGENLYTRALDADRQAVRLALISFLVVFFLGAVIATAIVWRLTRGLGGLAAASRAVASGNLRVRAPEWGADEIGLVARGFNHMLDELLSAERRAQSDPLTGLLNHGAFQDRLSRVLMEARQNGRDVCVLMIDINHFKRFNDTYGHQVGDRVLRAVADVLHRECRAGDFAARYGGDEFAVLAVGTELERGLVLAERIRSAAEHAEVRVREHESPLHITLAIGVACFPLEAETPIAVVALADERMYASKRAERRGVGF